MDGMERILVEVCGAPGSTLLHVPSSSKDHDLLSLLPPHQQVPHLLAQADGSSRDPLQILCLLSLSSNIEMSM